MTPNEEKEPEWLTKLREELMFSKMTHTFTLSRDELSYLVVRAALRAESEPVYQYKVGENWMDISKDEYLELKKVEEYQLLSLRILYTAPQTLPIVEREEP